MVTFRFPKLITNGTLFENSTGNWHVFLKKAFIPVLEVKAHHPQELANILGPYDSLRCW